MKKRMTHLFDKRIIYGVLSFVVPVLVMAGVYFSIGIYPGSETSILASDAFGQYSNFFASFNTMMKSNRSIFYTWSGSLGLNYLSLMSYYLGGIFTPLVYFFDNQQIPDFIYYLTLLKIGFMGVTFNFFSAKTFRIPKWGNLLLGTMYALMSFTIANSEMIMWMDGLIYLPLVILGIHQLMDQEKQILLFVSYFLLFISNFYIGFMVGVYSFLYFFIRLFLKRKRYLKNVWSYLVTSLLAGGAAMIMLLPAIMDLKNNGEALTQVAHLKTADTGLWDILIKNMIGVYDTTRYGSIPFIYVGLLPLLFCLFYFVTPKIQFREKIGYGSLLAMIGLSFYLEPLNLFWHGLHAPNMFLFRFSFLFSFTLLLLAGQGWSVYKKEDFVSLVNVLLGLITTFIVVKIITVVGSSYQYASYQSFILTLFFLFVYLFLFYLKHQDKKNRKVLLTLLIIGTVIFEVGSNAALLVQGISEDWVYSKRAGYDKDYAAIQTLVQKTQEKEEYFYRTENLTATSSNESFRYGYSGIGLFSSIRNRHSSFYLNQLGFRSQDTNLFLSYLNNTIMMDAIMGVKYNLSNKPLSKFGFEEIAKKGEYYLYENEFALPMGIITDEKIYQPEIATEPSRLLSQLSGEETSFYDYLIPEIVDTENTTIESNQNIDNPTIRIKAKEKSEPMTIRWKVTSKANTQLYLELLLTDFSNQKNTEVRVISDRQETRTRLTKTGQFYSLGHYEKEQEVEIETKFYHTEQLELFEPTVPALDTVKLAAAVERAQEKGVEFQVKGRKAEAEVEVREKSVLFTTIAPDKGWKAFIDGKETSLRTISDGLLSISVPAGKHKVTFVYLPQGFIVGVVLFISCVSLFSLYQYFEIRKKKSTQDTPDFDQEEEENR